MKILFVIPRQFNVYGGKTTKPRVPHIGIAYLSAYLKKQGHEIDVYDCTVEEDCDSLFGGFLLSYNIIGISLYSLSINSSYNLVNKIVAYLERHSNRKIPVVLGGPHVTMAKKEVLAKTGADFAIYGEGELTFIELIRNLKSSDNFNQIEGLIWRDKLGNIVKNPNREFIDNIDSLPLPDYSVFKLDRYVCSELNEIPINTSRGCPFECLFCAINLIAGRRFRARSPKNVVQEMMVNYNRGIRNFYIIDDAFNLNIKRAEAICDLIIKEDLKIKLVFQNGLRADYLTEKLVSKLKKAGCVAIVLSAESGNNDILKAIKKNITIERFNLAVDMIDKADINFIVNFIIGHPTETYDKAMDSIRLGRKISKRKNCATIMYFNLIPYPSTAVFEWIEKNGKWLLSKDKYLDSRMINTFPVFESRDFTEKERINLLEKGNRIHRASLLKFIFGKYLGFLAQYINNVEFIRNLLIRFAFSNKVGQGLSYSRFLRKLYKMQ